MATAKKAAKKATAKAPAKISVPKTLAVSSRQGAKIQTIFKDIETALGKVGCRACRSGIDKIVIGDEVMRNVK